MKYAFEPLVSVYFRHNYFSNGIFEGLKPGLSGPASREFLNKGLLLKLFNGGFHVLYDMNFANEVRGRDDVLKESISCRFILQLDDRTFYNYTESAGEDISKSIYYFSNTVNDGLRPGNALHHGDYAGAADLLPLEEVGDTFFARPFAILDLKLSEGLETRYTLNFRAKETYWRYILMPENFSSLNNPAILNSGNSEVFDGPETLPVNGKDTLAFISKSPISFSQDPAHIFQLVDNYDAETGRYRVVMRALPIADPGHITLIRSDTNTKNLNYSEIFIH
jgi:hypothetical protein